MPDLDDQQLFELLDRYVAALQSGKSEQCARWLSEYPQLRGMAECLEALDQFSSVRINPGEAATIHFVANIEGAATLAPGNGAAGAAAHAAQAGGDFGNYELLEEVGRGGMGVVYRARQRDLNRVVALKMILSSRLAGDEDVKRFRREARAAGSLRHPHIVGIHEVGEIHGQHFFSMDFIAGKSLAAVTKSGPADPEWAARCLLGVARAVQFLHDQGIVHRDLKPSNILIDAAGTPYVTDFGLAKVFSEQDDRTQTGVILGTAGYMSPEQASGRISAITPKSDIYGLGAILYELLTGRPPFREDNQLNTILQVLEGEPTLPNRLNPRIPPELERICLKCLEKDPDRRYTSATALADDLDRFLRCEPIEARPAGLGDRARRWLRRESGLAARLAIMAVVAVIMQTRHLIAGFSWQYHLNIKIAFGIWAMLAFVFQWFLRREKTAEFARLAWAVTDPLILTYVLYNAEEIGRPEEIGPILVGYPVLITASGLWFSVRNVIVSTIGCIVCYVTLLFLLFLKEESARRLQEESMRLLQEERIGQPHYPFIFVTALIVMGSAVAYQVYRVRTLSRYFEQTRPPV